MRKNVTSISIVVSLIMAWSSSVCGQIPQEIWYDGVSTQFTGSASIRLLVYTNMTGGTYLYEDSNTVVIAEDGFYSAIMGDDTVYGSLSNALATGNAYVEAIVNGSVQSPRDRILPVAYALKADGASSDTNFLRKIGGTISGSVTNESTVTAVGFYNSQNTASGENSFAIGGKNNIASGMFASVAAGEENTAGERYAFVGNGYQNQALGGCAVIVGGTENYLEGWGSFVGGGSYNILEGDYYCTIVAGKYNAISGCNKSFIGGGEANRIESDYALISGGFSNIIKSSSEYSVIGGGYSNYIKKGVSAVIPGGYGNTVTGEYGFAAGRLAKVGHSGTFVWSDASSDSVFPSTASNQFLIRASGGVGINTNATPDAALVVAGNVKITGSALLLYIPPQGDLSMGSYTNDAQ